MYNTSSSTSKNEPDSIEIRVYGDDLYEANINMAKSIARGIVFFSPKRIDWVIKNLQNLKLDADIIDSLQTALMLGQRYRGTHFMRLVERNEGRVLSILLHPKSAFPSQSFVARTMFRLMPAEKAEDATACLEELFVRRFLDLYSGDEKKAAQMVKWQMYGYIWRYYQSAIAASAVTLLGYFGAKNLGETVKGWFSN